MSVFGQVEGSPPLLQTDGTRNIVTAMKERGLSRIVTLSGEESFDSYGVARRWAEGLGHPVRYAPPTAAEYAVGGAERHAHRERRVSCQ